jgi:hypothetical protein
MSMKYYRNHLWFLWGWGLLLSWCRGSNGGGCRRGRHGELSTAGLLPAAGGRRVWLLPLSRLLLDSMPA